MASQRMTGTLTIRLTSELRRKLAARSKALGKSPSAVARSTLEAALADEDKRTLADRIRKHIGSVSSRDVPRSDDLRRAMEEWHPDRRD